MLLEVTSLPPPTSTLYFSYNFSKHLPYVISPKWEIIIPLFGGAEMKSSVLWSDSCKQRCALQGSKPAIWASSLWVSVSNQPPIAAFPFSLASHYVRSFFYRDELWARSEYFRCQTSCFSLSNVTSPMTRCIAEWHHGIKLRMVEEKWLWEPRDLCLSFYLSASCWKMLNKKSANEYSLCREQGS